MPARRPHQRRLRPVCRRQDAATPQHAFRHARPGARATRRPPLLPPGERPHALPQHDLSRRKPDRERRRPLPGLPHRPRRGQPWRDPPPHARRTPALSGTRLASAPGQAPIPRCLPVEHPEEDIMKLLRILLLLTLAAPGLSQPEDEPYFSLSSMRTFGAGGKPSVSLNAWNVDTLEFRVYRVNDPVQFFQQLESAHEF